MKIALCQTSMYWTIEENVESILQWIQRAAKEKADLAVFTECAITGYHRKMPQTVNLEDLQNAYQKIGECAIENNISVIVGSPFIEAESLEKIYNSMLYFNPKSKPKTFEKTSKIGLTAAETLFFAKGQKRETFKVDDLNIGIVFCREMLDEEELLHDYQAANLDLLIWPSYIKWDGERESGEKDYIDAAHTISQKLNVPILNVNAANSLNDLSLRGLGASFLVKNGGIVFKLAEDEEELRLIEV